MLPQSVDSVVLLQEAGRVPLLHGWLKQTLTWYNRVVKTYEEEDIVYKCLCESIGSALPDTWGRTFHSVLTGMLKVHIVFNVWRPCTRPQLSLV